MDQENPNFSKPAIEGTEVKPPESSVKNYEFREIRNLKAEQYLQVKTRLGSLAATDPDKSSLTIKDQRFTLSPIVRNLLSIEEEERARIDEKIQARLQEIAEEAKKAGQQMGFEEGFAKGRAEAAEKFQSEASSKMESLEKLVSEMEDIKKRIYADYERFFIEMIFKISKRVLLKDLSTDREYLSRLCAEILTHLEIRENIRIRIHPDELDSISVLKKELESKFKDLKNFSIEPSSQVASGGCILETDWNTIDARIETQLESIHSALMKAAEEAKPPAKPVSGDPA